MSENAIDISGLGKTYRGFALSEVSLSVPRGYITGLIGPNGAGKTTLVKLIMNLIRRDTGQIRVFGLDNIQDEEAIKSRVGFVYDEPCFPGDVTLADIGRAVSRFYERWDEAEFRRLIGEFELPLRGKRFKKLSHGMKAKFALALALSHHADLLIMDEPTAGLDPVFRRDLLHRLSELLQSEQKTVLFSTHITSDLERIADYITFICGGRVLLSEEKDTLLEGWGLVKGGEELLQEPTRGFFRGVCRRPHGVEALTDNVEEARRRFGGEALVEAPSLDDIMFLMSDNGNGGSE